MDEVGYGNLNIGRFCEIPEEQRTPENAKLWLLHKISRDSEPLNACYQEIPLELRSFGVMMAAAKNGLINILDGLDANQTPSYVMLAEAVTRRNYRHITFVDPAYRWQVLPDYCLTHIESIDKISKEIAWFRSELSPAVFEKCCMNIDFALDSPIEMLPEHLLQEMVVKNYSAYPAFRSRGLFHVMAARIAAGDWPPESSDYAFSAEKPRSLEAGILLLGEQEPGSDHETLYMAYAMTYPIEQVVPLMRDRTLKALLIEMYTKEALKPFIRADRELRGVILEDSMGL